MNATSSATSLSIPPSGYLENTAPDSSCQAQSALVKRYISERDHLTVYPNCIEFKPRKRVYQKTEHSRIERGKIRGFSPRSRFRLFATLAKIRDNKSNHSLFWSMTYHYAWNRKCFNTKSDLHNFLVRLRQYDTNVQYIWRLELQDRKAPHFHLIVFPSSFADKVGIERYNIEASRIWHDVAEPESSAHLKYGFKSVIIDSYRKACAYLGKYIAKIDGRLEESTIGKHWGNSQNLPFDRIESYSLTKKQSKAIIESLRKYLVEKGKEQYADQYYFNIDKDQTVFISHEEWEIIRDEVLKHDSFSP